MLFSLTTTATTKHEHAIRPEFKTINDTTTRSEFISYRYWIAMRRFLIASISLYLYAQYIVPTHALAHIQAPVSNPIHIFFFRCGKRTLYTHTLLIFIRLVIIRLQNQRGTKHLTEKKIIYYYKTNMEWGRFLFIDDIYLRFSGFIHCHRFHFLYICIIQIRSSSFDVSRSLWPALWDWANSFHCHVCLLHTFLSNSVLIGCGPYIFI